MLGESTKKKQALNLRLPAILHNLVQPRPFFKKTEILNQHSNRRQTRGSKMSEKKVVSRRVFIALEIVCIILVACLVGATSLYRWQIDDKDNTITSLQSQMNNLTSIVNLANSTVWVNNQTISEPAAGSGIAWNDWTFSTNYAGYVTVTVLSANASVWAHVIYFSWNDYFYDALSYNTSKIVGPVGSFFPVLPSSNVTVGVGNGNLVDGATETVTITYYY